MLKEILKDKRNVIVVSDFDGTISKKDVSYTLLEKFTNGDWSDIDSEYIKGNIGSKEAFSRILQKINATKSELLDYIEEVSSVDPHFGDFYSYLKNRGIELVIASDGFKMYIDKLMGNIGLSEIPVYANDIVENGEGNLTAIFPHHNEECGRCGTCKTNLIKSLLKKHDYVIFIGDGYSDSCASPHPHTLFATGFLFTHAAKEKIPCTYFEGFDDILNEFEKDIQGVIFDLDDTLVESLESIKTAFFYTIEKLKLDIDAEYAFEEMMHWPLSVSFEKLFPDVDLNLVVKTFREKYHSIYLDMTTVKEGIFEILEGLKNLDVKLTIATNKHGPYARKLVEHLKLSDYFIKVIGTGDIEQPKPSPDMIEEALLQMGTEKNQTILVGDSWIDIETGKNAGIDVYSLAQSLDTPKMLAEYKPRKMFYTTAELLKEFMSI